MIGRVKIKDSNLSMVIDWEKFVFTPQRKGYYIEAFTTADAFIDDMIDHILRSAYKSGESQSLINAVGGGLKGLKAANVLLKGKHIERVFFNKLKVFKEKRNLVCHEPYGEYALIGYNLIESIPDQEEYDNATKIEADKWLKEAYEIWRDLSKNGLIN